MGNSSSPASPPTKRRRLLAVMPPLAKPPDILAAFGATKSHSPGTKPSAMQMAADRDLRQRPTVTYAESDESSPEDTPRTDRSFQDPLSSTTSVAPGVGDSENESEGESESESDDEITVVTRPPVSGRRTGLQRSARQSLSYAPSPRPMRKSKHGRKRPSAKLLTSNLGGGRVTLETTRNRIRQAILEDTKPRRDAFLLANKDSFLPVLPETSYIDKLQRRYSMTGNEEKPHTIPYQAIDQPHGVKAVMKPYQLEGLSWLVWMFRNGTSCILGDEMGLGKTLQTLSLFQHLAETAPNESGEDRPHLVICPMSVLSSWMHECRRWVPDLNAVRFHGSKAQRERLKQELRPTVKGSKIRKGSSAQQKHTTVDVIVTTYETFVSEAHWFKTAFAWRYCVLDEGHKIKNDKAEISTALQSLQAEFRLLLTGTPLQNNLHEMWALLHWLYPDVFGIETAAIFKNAFDLTFGRVSTSFMDKARSLLELVMLRRMKSSPGVNLGLPPKEEILLYVSLTPVQHFWYLRLLTKADNATLNDLFKDAKSKIARTKQEEEMEDKHLALLEQGAATADAVAVPGNAGLSGDVWNESMGIIQQAFKTDQNTETKGANYKALMNLVMQLRKICSHPYLLPHAAPEPYYLGDHVVRASGKFIVLQKLVQELVIRRGKKLLIFSGFTRTLDLCEDLLTLAGGNTNNAAFRYSRLDGGTGRSRRNLSIRLFNQIESDFKIMLISTRAGGLGINLATASDVVFMDEDWNPQITLQAEARAHRIGQKNPVTVYKICTQGTVEEQMMGRIRKKLFLSAKITESMKNSVVMQQENSKKRKRPSPTDSPADDTPQLGTSQLMSLIRKGAKTLAHTPVDVTAMLDWDFKTMIEQCRDKSDDQRATGQEGSTFAADEQAWLNSMERVECAVFEGKKVQRQLEKKVEEVELTRADRRIGKNTTVMIDGFAINKESLNCADWEAVPTFAGKDPRLAEPEKIKRALVVNQDHCVVCYGGGDLVCCERCPRSFHEECLTDGMRSKSRGFGFVCQQHECVECGAKTADAGGLIYRCRWCPNGYCDDCLEPRWDEMNLLKDTLPEFEMLGFPRNENAWFVDCPECVQHWATDPADKKIIDGMREEIEAQYEKTVAFGA